MFTNPLAQDFTTDLYADDIIADYDTYMAGTDQEVAKVVSHSGKVAELIDVDGIISYSIYSDELAREHGEYDHIGAIVDDADSEEFLALLK